jgi:hypothetical protein
MSDRINAYGVPEMDWTNFGVAQPPSYAPMPAVGGASGLNFGGSNTTNVSPSGLGSGLGMNIGTGQLALGGLGALGNMFTSMQAQGLAKKSFDFQKGVTNTNLANQIKTLNTSIMDRARARGAVEGQSQSQVDDYINRNSLSR